MACEVLEEALPWMTDINRPTQVRRSPSILIKDKVAGLLTAMDGVMTLPARLLHSIGMRVILSEERLQQLAFKLAVPLAGIV